MLAPDQLLTVTRTRDEWKYVRAVLNQHGNLPERGWNHGSMATFNVYKAISEAIGDRPNGQPVDGEDYLPTDRHFDATVFKRCTWTWWSAQHGTTLRCGEGADHLEVRPHAAYSADGGIHVIEQYEPEENRLARYR